MAIRVFSHENLAIVHNAKNVLETADIECQIRNEFHGGGGHVGLNIVPIELWVKHDTEISAASKLLTENMSEE